MAINRSVPIVNQPNLYMDGLRFATVGGNQMQLFAGECRDSTNTYDMQLTSSILINPTVVGVNGLDTGVLVASTVYYIYLISDPVSGNPTAALLSTSKTAPVMPYGYGAFRIIGGVPTDGAALLTIVRCFSTDQTRTVYFIVPLEVLAAGAATTVTSVPLAAFVPTSVNTIFSTILLQMQFQSASANDSSKILVQGNTSSNMAQVNGLVAPGVGFQSAQVMAVPGGDGIYYQNSAAAGSLRLLLNGYIMDV